MQTKQEMFYPRSTRRATLRLWAWITVAFILVLTAGVALNRIVTPAVFIGYTGTALQGPATNFHLVDQYGVQVALSDFRGQVVVLTFFDSQCRDVCPLTAVHLRTVYHTLNAPAAVTFLGVNVNTQANTVADMMTTTQQWHLDEIPTWHFLTGSPVELAPVWQAYHVGVVPEAEDIMHTPGVYLVDQVGQMRWYLSVPFEQSGESVGFTLLSALLLERIQELLAEG